MAKLGKMNRLQVSKTSPYGMYLAAGAYGEVLLPNKLVPRGLEQGEEVDVFLHRDSHDRLVATTDVPLAQAGDFALLKVRDVSKVGVFLDWGLEKDLLLPFGEQKNRPEVGELVFVRVGIDPKSERLYASTKINRYLKGSTAEYEEGDEVNLQVVNRTDLGTNVIVDNQCWGLIFHDEISCDLRRAQKLKGYIKERREDGKLTIALQRAGMLRVDDGEQVLLDELRAKGHIPLTDKSDPDLIRSTLGMSKKVFKKAVGGLYRKRMIVIESDRIRLADEDA